MAWTRATMDFFGSQARSRRRTCVLVALFLLAAVTVASMTYAVLVGYGQVLVAIVNYFRISWEQTAMVVAWHSGRVFGPISAVVFLGLVGVSVHKIIQLTAPVEHVMGLLAATRVTRDARYPATRRFLDVVEEIALASGVPVPQTYLLTHEQGINALAVGRSPTEAAIAVTSGSLEQLTRAELQGIVAHEFSHILNGDMRLNVRLLGMLHGIDAVGYLGRKAFDFAVLSGRARLPGRDNAPAVLGFFLFFLLLPFVLVSLVGSSLANLIRAAVSRQREYLADAAAVQFTRQPDGLGGALKKIATASVGSILRSAFAEETRHFFVADAVGQRLLSPSSHPPLLKRIACIDPTFDGSLPRFDIYTQVFGSRPNAAAETKTHPAPAVADDHGLRPVPESPPGIPVVPGQGSGSALLREDAPPLRDGRVRPPV